MPLTRTDATFEIQQYHADEIEMATWAELAMLNYEAVSSHYRNIPQILRNEHVQKSIGLYDLEKYAERMTHPSAETSDRNIDQLFNKPLVHVVLNKQDRIVSWTAAVDNTSAPDANKKMHAFLPIRRWHLVRWMATHPDYQGLSLASAAVAAGMEFGARRIQPNSAYAWPSATAKHVLQLVGMESVEPNAHDNLQIIRDKPIPTERFVSAKTRPELIRSALLTSDSAKLQPRVNVQVGSVIAR